MWVILLSIMHLLELIGADSGLDRVHCLMQPSAWASYDDAHIYIYKSL